MIKNLLIMVKGLWLVWKNPPKQEFVNELYLRQQAQMYKHRYGIGNGARGLPPGKYFR